LNVVSRNQPPTGRISKNKGEIMHDIDRTALETGYGQYEYEADEYESGDEFEDEGQFSGGMLGESPFSEAEEMELAAELLSVTNEQELDQFIGKLLKKAGSAFGKFASSSVGSKLGGIIKGAARSAMPLIGSAVGNFLLPGVGGAMGGKLASAAGSMLGLELEGLSHEDQEFEIARQIVRFGGAAASNAAEVSPSTPPEQSAQTAAVAAARQYAPGLLNPNAAAQRGGRRCRHRKSGRWVRSGNKIIILGA